jgi:hypothetical protein
MVQLNKKSFRITSIENQNAAQRQNRSNNAGPDDIRYGAEELYHLAHKRLTTYITGIKKQSQERATLFDVRVCVIVRLFLHRLPSTHDDESKQTAAKELIYRCVQNLWDIPSDQQEVSPDMIQ